MVSMNFIIAVVLAYLLGNISPSTIQAKARGMDIKKEGSGNAGTTNTLRVLGARAALVTLVVDIGKGVLAVCLAGWIAPEAANWCACAAFFGHVFPVLLKFRGGKGIAVAFGVLLALDWKLALIMLAIVGITVILSRRVSMGSIAGCVTLPVVTYLMKPDFLVFSIIMAAVALFKHRQNIDRLLHGEEEPVTSKWFKSKAEKGKEK